MGIKHRRGTPRTQGFTPFIVLLERRGLVRAIGTLLASLTLLLFMLMGVGTARAQSSNYTNKVAADLRNVIESSKTPKLSWVRDVKGQRHVKALVVSNSTDPDLVALRSAVMNAGGSVYMRYVSVRALSVMLPAGSVAALAERSDVQGISPNRLTARTMSVLEQATGSTNLRSYNGSNYTGLDGRGVGIAVLDSGIEKYHSNLLAADGKTLRVRAAVDFQKVGDAKAMDVKDWTPGIDVSASMYPGSATMANYESQIDSMASKRSDLYGHGTHVASIAAGRGAYQRVDSSGVAPGADLYDVKVLDGNGYGQMSDALAGIDWVIYNARRYNIRVMNLSLAADSTESWQTDPLARAARAATAAGITVVVAAGNYGRNANGVETYGSIGSPGHDPSVITVGSANTKGTISRGDDVVNNFSSRGPTRGAYVDAQGIRQIDNLLKPDLVAPGNRVVGALATDQKGSGGAWNQLAKNHRELTAPYGDNKQQGNGRVALMDLSGTSVAAPVVSGTVALMLQANPGLTPPLIKAILQYSAQPITGANLVQQGAGLLNVDGAVRLAQVLRTDISTAINAGTLTAGANLLASGKTLPAPTSSIGGQTFNWSRIVFAGGNRIVSGSALFAQYQPIYDPRFVWAGTAVRRSVVTYWPASNGTPANTYVRSVVEAPASNQQTLTPGLVSADSLAGDSSLIGQTGVFLPSATMSSWLASGTGIMLSEGVIVSEGRRPTGGILLSEGIIVSEGVVLGEGIVMSEGILLSEGDVWSESGSAGTTPADDSALLGEP